MTRLFEWLLQLKHGELSGADTWSVRFTALYNNWIIFGLFIVFVALVGLTIISYLREGDTPRRVKLGIASIRIAVIIAIFILLFQPGLVLRYRKNLYSSVVVLLDDSISMSLKDRYADPALRQILAKKLQVAPERLESLSRAQIVRAILASKGGALPKLSVDHPLIMLRFSTANPGREDYTRVLTVINHPASNGSEVSSEAISEISRALDEIKGVGFQTNLSAALRDTARKIQGRGDIAAIVLISDGQDTTKGKSLTRLQAARDCLNRLGVPVFALCVGDPIPPRNVKALRLEAPIEVRKGSDVELRVFISNRNCAGKVAILHILRKSVGGKKWEEVCSPKQVMLVGKPGSSESYSQEVKIKVEADKLGNFEYMARISPLGKEFSIKDNAVTTKMRISDKKIKVLLISGDAGWEFRYLRNMLLRNPDKYALSVWQQNAEAAYIQEASSKKMRLKRLPRTAKELFKYDVVILYDPAYTKNSFDGHFVELLEKWLSEHGGGLCYIASNKYTDTILTGQGPFKPLAAMLPVVLGKEPINIAERIIQVKPIAWQVMPTPEGLEHPILRLGRDARESARIWSVFPGIYWSHPVLALKPLATPLLVSGDPTNRTAGPDAQPAPIAAIQFYGKGRSLYMGTDETWRWRYVQDASYHRRFWDNVMDYLAAGSLEKKRLIITTGGEHFIVGQKLKIRVEAYGRNYEPLTDEKFLLEMVNTNTGKSQQLTLKRGKSKGRYETTVTLKEVGRYKLMASQAEFKKEGITKTITVTLPEEEFIHPEADPATLETIAPGERFMMINQADRLMKLIPRGKTTIFRDVPHDLWDVPLILALLVMLLAAEWILRKKYNMI